jgi:KipI family sensor histidine kinase inhibitor
LSFPRVLPVGDAAATVELGDALDPATNARVRALDHELLRSPFEGLREAVPALCSLLVLYDPAVVRFDAVARAIGGRLGGKAPPPPARRHEIAVEYGGEHGPDLEPLASRLGIAPGALAQRHASVEYTAFMLGFSPGFAYLGLLPEPLDVPRQATPRVRVPAGSVGAAGRLTGIYPAASAGGWQLLGRTSRRLFDPAREEPSLLAPGDRVRFVPVRELPPPEAGGATGPAEAAAAVEVTEPGLLTTVQDGGRAGHRRIGVSASGPLDGHAHARANRAVGNDAAAAALECTICGPTLVFRQAVRFAIAGADLGAVLERSDLGPWAVPLGAAVLARPGNVLRFRGRAAGCRASVAFAGGIDAAPVLGSAATDVVARLGAFGGRPLAAGDGLVVRRRARFAEAGSREGAAARAVCVRVVPGPQEDALDPGSRRALFEEPWRVGVDSDRVGCRLDGPALRHRGRAEILSDGMVPGSIQVPPDGRPIVMLADGPTSGGYPKPGTVVSADLPLLAQLVPGEGVVRFARVRVEDVQP